MKTFTLDQFQKFLSEGGFKTETDHEEFWRDHRNDYDKQTGEPVSIEYVHGGSAITHEKDGVKITYNEGWEYDNYMPNTFEASTDGLDEVWTLEGALVVDEDGDDVRMSDLVDDMIDHLNCIDYSDIIKEIDQIDDLTQGNSKMKLIKLIKLNNDNAPDIKFNGELIAASSNRDHYNDGGRWDEIRLYKTDIGKYITHDINFTLWGGETSKYKATVCDTVDDVIDALGYSDLAKEIYCGAKIECDETIA